MRVTTRDVPVLGALPLSNRPAIPTGRAPIRLLLPTAVRLFMALFIESLKLARPDMLCHDATPFGGEELAGESRGGEGAPEEPLVDEEYDCQPAGSELGPLRGCNAVGSLALLGC